MAQHVAAAAPLDAPSAVSRGDWCTRPKGMNVAAAEAAAAVAVAATLLPGECWAACVGFAGTFCLSLCALSSLFTPLSSVFCFVLCFCCFWVVALGDGACEALSQSALSSLPLRPACPACLCAHSLSISFSLFAALSRAVAILFKSFGRETLRRVCVVACQDWQRSSSAVGQQASAVSQSVANAAGARISTSSQATLPTSSQSQLTHFARFSHVNFNCLSQICEKC